MDLSGEFWGRFDTWAGPSFGVFLFGIGAYLMYKGAEKIKLFSFLTGCAIGQISSALLFDNLSDFVDLSEGDFTLLVTSLCGFVMVIAVRLMSLAVTAYISLHVMLWIVSMVEANGYDVGTELIGGILVGVSFFINRYMRKNLYLFGSAALGTLMVIYGYLVMNGEIPSQISIMHPTTQLIGLALFVNSVMIQRKVLKDSKSRKDESKSQKREEKRQRIENDVHGRGRFFEPDILTQAAIDERNEWYEESFNLNRSRRNY